MRLIVLVALADRKCSVKRQGRKTEVAMSGSANFHFPIEKRLAAGLVESSPLQKIHLGEWRLLRPVVPRGFKLQCNSRLQVCVS